jgi:hypothetical protein
MRWYSDDTQIRWACLQLIKGREISHAHEIAETRGWRLAPIIHNLKKLNWPILTRYGERGIAYYRLGKVDIRTTYRYAQRYMESQCLDCSPYRSSR